MVIDIKVKKICPLQNIECKEEKCAWWDADVSVCAVKGIYDSLYWLNKNSEPKVEVKGD